MVYYLYDDINIRQNVPSGHLTSYWDQRGNIEREVFADLAVINASKQNLDKLEDLLSGIQRIFNDNFGRM
jgi:hypothetical protein